MIMKMVHGSEAHNRYFGRIDTGKVKIQGVMARKGDTLEYMRRMQQELFDCLGEAWSSARPGHPPQSEPPELLPQVR